MGDGRVRERERGRDSERQREGGRYREERERGVRERGKNEGVSMYGELKMHRSNKKSKHIKNKNNNNLSNS